jgi:hypothetical protein
MAVTQVAFIIPGAMAIIATVLFVMKQKPEATMASGAFHDGQTSRQMNGMRCFRRVSWY